jgi:hypothetical protein
MPGNSGYPNPFGFETMVLEEFKKLIGKQSYAAFIDLLKEVGPDARTHRISVVFAAILRYALEKVPEDYEETPLCQTLAELEEGPYFASEDSENYEILYELIDAICKEARIQNERQSARGDNYSISDSAISEFMSWYNMPWEDD